MKIAIPTDGDDLDTPVSHRFGVAPHVLLTDEAGGRVEAVPNPTAPGARGAGLQMVALVLDQEAGVVLTGSCSPNARQHLEANEVKVFDGLRGTAGEVLQQYRSGALAAKTETASAERPAGEALRRQRLQQALRQSVRQFVSMLPILTGVVLLIGLFRALVSRAFLATLFPGDAVLDVLWGGCMGSLLAGNPINSYIIGGELLQRGVSLFAVTAFVLTWTTVGLVQLPAEIVALGWRFAVLRNALAFVLALPVSFATVLLLDLLPGGMG